ncbi:protein LTO1 homolog isoform X2 [Gouania willdenowi]|uniref:Essential protein Yae1 N-terminal domain-containing protein n=1 Tax=Gouania willdenowi TaxID=441366 RepID=A0A8C5GK77_GOUWI|nr:protein LTO1 homolog isoform X2 [Gouania willdenowi]
MAIERSGDIFDSILLADDMFRGEGYREGYAQGTCRGLMGGRRHGSSHGARLSNEFYFYHGFASTWKYLLQQNTDAKCRKRLKVLESLLGLIQDCPLVDPQSAKLPNDAEKIRAKFRQACSLLSVPTDFKDYTQAPDRTSF